MKNTSLHKHKDQLISSSYLTEYTIPYVTHLKNNLADKTPRVCIDCDADISHRNGNATRCRNCAIYANRRRAKKWRQARPLLNNLYIRVSWAVKTGKLPLKGKRIGGGW